jgi:hypothetical protein
MPRSQEGKKMGPSRKEPSARTLSELVDLLLKLNSKIREKISPRPEKETKGAKNMETVIIILNHSPGAPAKTPRPEKIEAPASDWVEDLCEEIEKGSGGQMVP